MFNLYAAALLALSICANYCYGQDHKHTIIIAGEISGDTEAKTATLLYWENVISHYTMKFTTHQRKVAPITDDRFQFEIHPENPSVYLTVGWEYGNKGMVNETYPYFFRAKDGDSVTLNIERGPNGYDITFEGEGAAKYSAVAELSKKHRPDFMNNWYLRNKIYYNLNDFEYSRIKINGDAADYFVEQQLTQLFKYKPELGADVYNLYKTDIVSNVYGNYANALYKLYDSLIRDHPDDSVKRHIELGLTSLENKIDHFNATVGNDALSRSAFYPVLQLYMAKVKAKLEGVSIFDVITKLPPSLMRDRLLANFFFRRGDNLDSATKDSLFEKTAGLVTNTFCLKEMTNYVMSTKVGREAYDFSLPDSKGKQVRLSDFRGKVVFIDFWYVGCGGCSSYYRNVLKHVEKRYKEDPAVVFITVSIDKDRERWMEGVRKGIYTSEEVINLHCPDGTENPIIQQFAVGSYPHPLLIDREGNVFSDSSEELRSQGIDGLVSMIEKAKVISSD